MERRRKLLMMVVMALVLFNQLSFVQCTWAANAWNTTASDASGVSDNDITLTVDNDQLGDGSFILIDDNGSSTSITTIASNAQSTTISATTNSGGGGTSTVTSTLTVDGATGTTNSGNFSVNGTTTLSSTLGVAGATTLTGALTANGGISADGFTVADGTGNMATNGTLGVTGATTLTGALTANGGISADGGVFTVADVTGNVATSGTLGVTGATTLGNTLGVTGATTLGNTLGVTGATTLGNTLNVTGNTTLTGSLTANSGISADGFTVADGSGNLTASGATNTIGTAGSSANTLTGASNTITSTIASSMSGDNASVSLFEDSAVMGVAGGSNFTATATDIQVTTADGHGLIVDQTSHTTTLSGGETSSTWTLADGSATLDVDTTQVFEATNNGTATSVTIGGDDNVSNQLLANAEGGTNLIEADTTNTLTAGTDNVLNAGGQNQLTGGTGNIITATTGNNEMTAAAGSNILSANVNTITGTTSSSMSGSNASVELSEDSASIGVTGGAEVIATDTQVTALTAGGDGLTVIDDEETTRQATLLVNDHGLTIDGTANTTTLTGGTNSSSLELADDYASLGVGTEESSEIEVLRATNDGEVTSVTIGGSSNAINNLTANAETGTNNIEAANNNIGVATADSHNTIGNTTSTNIITGATNSINGETTITSANGSHVASVTGSNIQLSGGNTGMTITGATESGAANTIVMTADNDSSSANARSIFSMSTNSASLLVNNASTGESHGISVEQTQTVISGGTDSTSLTLDDTGATFRNDTTGGPAQVTGVANGVHKYDAVNMGQYRALRDTAFSGIAAVSAIAAVPPPVPGKNFSVGLGYGNFESSNAVAVGAKALVGNDKNITLTAGVGLGEDSSVFSGGVGWSF